MAHNNSKISAKNSSVQSHVVPASIFVSFDKAMFVQPEYSVTSGGKGKS